MAMQATTKDMTVSAAGLALIQRHEGFRTEAALLPDGRFVVGYGQVVSAPPLAPVSQETAEAALRADLQEVEALLHRAILAPVSQAQFDALASFAFSIGPKAFEQSDVLRRLNAGEPIAAAVAMDAWRKSAVMGEPQVIDALVRRRAAEKAMFLEVDAPVAAPSAFLRPALDHAQAILSSADIAQTPDINAAKAQETVAVAEKLADILESEPATAALLRAKPTQTEDEPVLETFTLPAPAADGEVGSVLELTERAPDAAGNSLLGAIDPKETRAFVLLAAAGLLLIVVGAAVLFSGADGGQTAFLMLSAPGIVIAGMAGYYLARAQWGQKAPRLQGVAA